MNKQLLRKMSEDMQIDAYQGENIDQFACRVIHSALAEWMRCFILDLDEKGVEFPKSKVYVLRRGQRILAHLLGVFPECRKWFVSPDTHDESYKEYISFLRESMIQSEEFIFDDSRISVPMPSLYDCGFGVFRLVGDIDNDVSKAKVCGITRIVGDSHLGNLLVKGFLLHSLDVRELFEKSHWTVCDTIENYEFFKPRYKAPLYSSWDRIPDVTMNYHLSRIQLINGMSEYYLMKCQGAQWSASRLNEVLVARNEYRRIMLWLRKSVENPMKLYFRYMGNCVVFNRNCRFPATEETVINTFCWPIGAVYLDDMSFVAPIELWPMMLEVAKQLSIEVQEDKNGSV